MYDWFCKQMFGFACTFNVHGYFSKCLAWNTWKVMEFYNFILQGWNVSLAPVKSWKVMENQQAFYE